MCLLSKIVYKITRFIINFHIEKCTRVFWIFHAAFMRPSSSSECLSLHVSKIQNEIGHLFPEIETGTWQAGLHQYFYTNVSYLFVFILYV